jgi:hypothetical protein
MMNGFPSPLLPFSLDPIPVHQQIPFMRTSTTSIDVPGVPPGEPGLMDVM